MNRHLLIAALAASLAAVPMSALALSSSSYTIPQFDMHSFGNSISSPNFGIRASSGPIVGVANSANYSLDTGFPAVTGSVVTLSLSSPTVNLGTLVPGSPVSGTTTTTVSTDSSAGYSLALQKDRAMTHTDNVTTISDFGGSIASPSTYNSGDTGLGFSVSAGTNVDSKWNSGLDFAAIPTLATTTYHTLVQSISAPNTTTITYKLNVGVTQKPGIYSTSVAIYASALP